MKNKKKKILLIYTHFSTFVEQDYEILSASYQVDKYLFVPNKNVIQFIFQFIHQFLFLTFKGWKYDAFFIWFADYHSFLPIYFAKISNKKSFLVIGGYDASRINSLKYGVFYNRTRGFFAKQSISNSTVNLCVSKHIKRIIDSITKNSKSKLLYNCVSFKSATSDSIKNNTVLSVAMVSNEQTYFIKGIDTYIEVARKMPETKFRLIGLNKTNLKHLIETIPDNLTINDFMPHEELISFYRDSMVYCQLSRSESFSLSLAEAMYFKCIPIITNIGGMPEVAGTYGRIVSRDAEKIKMAIEHCFQKPNSIGIQEHITDFFSITKRKNELLKILINHKI